MGLPAFFLRTAPFPGPEFPLIPLWGMALCGQTCESVY